jgi:hypothetical protein
MAVAVPRQTVADIRALILAEGAVVPSGVRKRELLLLLQGIRAQKELPVPLHATSSSYTSLTGKYADPSVPWLRHLELYGWCTVAIPGCSPERYVEALYRHLEDCSPVSLDAIKAAGPTARQYPRLSPPAFRRDMPSTWTSKNMPASLHGILKQYTGQTAWQWELRELCYPLFSQVYGTGDLLASFDGACFLKPLECTSKGGVEASRGGVEASRGGLDGTPAVSGYKQWLHLDQDRLHELVDGLDPSKMSCVQGLVNLLDSSPVDGGLVLVERSHLSFAGYFQRHPADGFSSFFKVDMSDPELRTLPVIKVCAPAGHLVLWDSRIVHANAPPSRQAVKKPRMCAYVSMQPRSHASEKDLERRVRLYEAGRQTGHVVGGHALKETSKHPMTYGGPVVMPAQPFESARLSPLGRRLVGYPE